MLRLSAAGRAPREREGRGIVGREPPAGLPVGGEAWGRERLDRALVEGQLDAFHPAPERLAKRFGGAEQLRCPLGIGRRPVRAEQLERPREVPGITRGSRELDALAQEPFGLCRALLADGDRAEACE